MVPSGLVQVMTRSGVMVECPAAFVGEVMMPGAYGSQIVDVGVAVVAPEHHVMDLALIERHLTPTTNTGAMHRSQFATLRPVHGALGATEVTDDPVGVEGGEGDFGVAAQPAGGLHRQRDAGGCFADPMVVVAVMQGVVIDEQRHIRHPQLRRRGNHLEPTGLVAWPVRVVG